MIFNPATSRGLLLVLSNSKCRGPTVSILGDTFLFSLGYFDMFMSAKLVPNCLIACVHKNPLTLFPHLTLNPSNQKQKGFWQKKKEKKRLFYSHFRYCWIHITYWVHFIFTSSIIIYLNIHNIFSHTCTLHYIHITWTSLIPYLFDHCPISYVFQFLV